MLFKVLSILTGRDTDHLMEYFGEIAGSIESAMGGDIGDGQLVIGQQNQTFLNAVIPEVFNGRLAQHVFKQIEAFAAAYGTRCGNLLQGDALGMMCFNKIQHAHDRLDAFFRLMDAVFLHGVAV